VKRQINVLVELGKMKPSDSASEKGREQAILWRLPATQFTNPAKFIPHAPC
jgi:hypothetical protein